jgi:hypothetical protein
MLCQRGSKVVRIKVPSGDFDLLVVDKSDVDHIRKRQSGVVDLLSLQPLEAADDCRSDGSADTDD